MAFQISAQSLTFAVYSIEPDSVVLFGRRNFSPMNEPEIFPTLQGREFDSIVLGDYHYGALTMDGKLLTWGNADCSGLGYSSTSVIHQPREVKFDYEQSGPKRWFVLGVAAAGWHMGALVADLEVGGAIVLRCILIIAPRRNQEVQARSPGLQAPCVPNCMIQ
jgi:SCF-associated factor 1